MFELRRILCSPKRWIVFLLLAAVNLAFFSGFCQNREEQRIAQHEQETMFAQQEYDPDAEYEEYLSITYPRFLENVKKQSKSQSILSNLKEKSAFVDRNLEKTAKDYQKLGEIMVTRGENRGIEALAAFHVTDYLLLIAPLLLVLELAAGLQSASGALERTTKRGRVPVTLWRIVAIAVLSAISVLILSGGNFLYTVYRFGDPGLLRSIQSIPAYQLCPFRLTVGGYLLASFLLKTLAVTVISLLCWLMLARLQSIAAWLASFAGIGGSWLCWTLFLPTFSFNHPKFLSVFAPLNADIFFSAYCNLNFFGHPVGILTAMLVWMLFLLMLLTILCAVLIGYCKPAKLGANLTELAERIKHHFSRKMRPKTLTGFEGWRLLIVQKGWIVLLAAALGGILTFREIRMWSGYDKDSEKIFKNYSGPVTEENLRDIEENIRDLEQRIEKARKNLEEAQAKNADPYNIALLQQKLNEYEASLEIYTAASDHMHALADYTAATGNDAWYIKPDAYQILLRQSGSSRRLSLILLLVLIFLFAGSCAYDNQYDSTSLLRSTKRGRAGRRIRLGAWTAMLTIIGTVALHGIYLYCIQRDIGFYMPEAPAHSLEILRWLPFNCSMYTIIILLFAARIVIALMTAGCVILISKYSRTPEKALLTSLAVFLMPSVLAESGVTQLLPLDFVGHLLANR